MDADQAQARAKMIADTLFLLNVAWKVEKIGEANGSSILRGPFPHADWFFLCDNGGEFNVGPINRDSEMRSVAYTDNGYFNLLDAGTMAYRVWAVTRGEEIDYAWRGDDLLEIFLEAKAA